MLHARKIKSHRFGKHKGESFYYFWVTILLTIPFSTLYLSSGPNPDIKDGTLQNFPWAMWVHHPQTAGVMMLNGHPICWLVFLLSLTSRLNWEHKQRGPKAWAKSHNIMQKWTQKTKILPLSDLLFLFHFYSLASFHSPFPIMLHLRSIVLLTILKYFKDPLQVTGAVFRANLLDFHSIKQNSAKYLPHLGGWHSCPTPAGGKPDNKGCPLLATVRAALHWPSMHSANTVRVSSVFALQASDGIHVWTVIHHQKGYSFTRWFP